MKKRLLRAALGCVLVFPLVACSADQEKEAEATPPVEVAVEVVEPLASFKDKLSYSIGNDVASSLGQLKDEVSVEKLILGLQDGLAGKELLLSPEQMQEVQQQFMAQMQAKQEQELLEMKQKNLEAGEAFLAENKKKAGVNVTDSGLQYEIITEGTGAVPTMDDIVSVHYTGTLIDGTKFDSSHDRGEAAELPVSQIIPGWTEALQLMKVGSKARLVIPADLAYGENGAPPVIEPNSALVFELELLDIKDKPAVEEPAKQEEPVKQAEPAKQEEPAKK